MVYLSLIFPKLQGCNTLEPNPCSVNPLRLSQLRTMLCFKMDDKTKPCCRKSDCAEIVQHQIRIASAALAIQIISLLCLAFWCGRQKKPQNKTKNLIMVFIYLPARLIAPALVPLIALADALKVLHLSTVGGNGAGQGIHITLCPNASFHHTTSGLVCSGCWQICYSKQTNKQTHWELSLHVKLRKSITGKKMLTQTSYLHHVCIYEKGMCGKNADFWFSSFYSQALFHSTLSYRLFSVIFVV